jgi:hypothetical protein
MRWSRRRVYAPAAPHAQTTTAQPLSCFPRVSGRKGSASTQSSITQTHPRRCHADSGRPDSTYAAADVVAEPLRGTAQLGRIQLGKVDREPTKDALTKESERESDREHQPRCAERQDNGRMKASRTRKGKRRHGQHPEPTGAPSRSPHDVTRCGGLGRIRGRYSIHRRRSTAAWPPRLPRSSSLGLERRCRARIRASRSASASNFCRTTEG